MCELPSRLQTLSSIVSASPPERPFLLVVSMLGACRSEALGEASSRPLSHWMLRVPKCTGRHEPAVLARKFHLRLSPRILMMHLTHGRASSYAAETQRGKMCLEMRDISAGGPGGGFCGVPARIGLCLHSETPLFMMQCVPSVKVARKRCVANSSVNRLELVRSLTSKNWFSPPKLKRADSICN